jgi:hypothetical protein
MRFVSPNEYAPDVNLVVHRITDLRADGGVSTRVFTAFNSGRVV